MSYEQVDHADNPLADGAAAPMSEADQHAVEEERARRLDPANRPDGAEVDNTDTELPTVREFAERNAGDDDVEGSAGTADPGRAFREMEVPEEEQRAIAEERERRLDPANRPDGAEVDNTGRHRDAADQAAD